MPSAGGASAAPFEAKEYRPPEEQLGQAVLDLAVPSPVWGMSQGEWKL